MTHASPFLRSEGVRLPVPCEISSFVTDGLPVNPAGLGRLIASNLEDQLMRWLRAAELTCDRAALLVAQVSTRYALVFVSTFRAPCSSFVLFSALSSLSH